MQTGLGQVPVSCDHLLPLFFSFITAVPSTDLFTLTDGWPYCPLVQHLESLYPADAGQMWGFTAAEWNITYWSWPLMEAAQPFKYSVLHRTVPSWVSYQYQVMIQKAAEIYNSGLQYLYDEGLTFVWQLKLTKFSQVCKSQSFPSCLLTMMLYQVWRLISTNNTESNKKLMGKMALTGPMATDWLIVNSSKGTSVTHSPTTGFTLWPGRGGAEGAYWWCPNGKVVSESVMSCTCKMPIWVVRTWYGKTLLALDGSVRHWNKHGVLHSRNQNLMSRHLMTVYQSLPHNKEQCLLLCLLE